MSETCARSSLVGVLLAVALELVSACATSGAASTPVSSLHYAANDNIGPDGSYRPSRLGFNVADVGSRTQLDALPAGVVGLVYLGLCHGADAGFRSAVAPFVGAPNLFGFYLIDEPDPASCLASNLALESHYLHAQVRGARTFILVQNLASSRNPSYQGGYNRANTGIDLFGIDPYPCRTEIGHCDYGMIHTYVSAAVNGGIPAAMIVPVYQAFGGGQWVDDGGGRYVQPTPAQATQILREWGRLIPHPVFDYVYSYGVQRNDVALGSASPALQRIFDEHNRGLPLG